MSFTVDVTLDMLLYVAAFVWFRYIGHAGYLEQAAEAVIIGNNATSAENTEGHHAKTAFPHARARRCEGRGSRGVT